MAPQRMISECDPVQLLPQGLDPGEEGAAAAEGARDEAGLQVHGPQEGRPVVITILFSSNFWKYIQYVGY